MKQYHIITFGCQMNDHDSERMSGIMEQMGYVHTDRADEADVLLINTCAVRETAENKVYGLLGRLRKYKEKNPGMIIGVGGCLAQLEETSRRIRSRFPHISLVFGTGSLHQLPELISQAAENCNTIIDISQPEDIHEGIPVKREDGIKAWVPIIYGCNNFCTYCIVPYVRGRERSRKPGDIIREIEELALKGYREITLLGQNVNSYGKDLGSGYGFGDLLKDVNKIEGISRIRFMTSHPRDFNDDLLAAVTEADKVCEHFHIPIQAGSNKILKAMNRGYDREYYLNLVGKIRRQIPGAAITTDIMVGFPGETEEDFQNTMDVVEKVRYDAAFTFVYNIRKGTPAERMPGQVSEAVKAERIKTLLQRQNEIVLEKNAEEVGRIHEVLIEGSSRTDPGTVSGRTRTNKLVFLPGSEEDAGKTAAVKILGGTLTFLRGEKTGSRDCRLC